MNSNILPAGAFLIAIGILFAYVHPTWTGAIAETKQAIVMNDQALTAAEQYLNRQNQLASDRDAIDPANIATLATFLPESVDNVGLILDLNALAARSGLTIENIDVVMGDDTKGVSTGGALIAVKDPVGSVTLALSASGTFSAVKEFLRGVEKSMRLLDVQDLMVKGSETGVYTYQMTLRLYWLR